MNNNNINQKLDEVLKKLRPRDLQALASSPAVLAIVKNLNAKDKEKLLREFSSLDSSEINKKLANINLNDFKGLSSDEIIKRIRTL